MGVQTDHQPGAPQVQRHLIVPPPGRRRKLVGVHVLRPGGHPGVGANLRLLRRREGVARRMRAAEPLRRVGGVRGSDVRGVPEQGRASGVEQGMRAAEPGRLQGRGHGGEVLQSGRGGELPEHVQRRRREIEGGGVQEEMQRGLQVQRVLVLGERIEVLAGAAAGDVEQGVELIARRIRQVLEVEEAESDEHCSE